MRNIFYDWSTSVYGPPSPIKIGISELTPERYIGKRMSPYIDTKDLVCNREISFNLQNNQITYIESIGPKISTVHFANGGTVKLPIARAALVSLIEEANAIGSSVVTAQLTPEELEIRDLVQTANAERKQRESSSAPLRSTESISKMPTDKKQQSGASAKGDGK